MIDIKMYGAPKPDGAVTNSQITLQGDNSGNPFTGKFIWGQYFDGTEDINGDMKVNGTAYIDYSYMLRLNSTYINSNYLNTSYLGADYAYMNYLASKKIDTDYAAILKAFIGEMSCTAITTENLTVTKSAHFFELIIDQIKAAGGATIFSPANGFVVRKVDRLSKGYRLYFLAQERVDKIHNMWKKDDQALCQNFNRASQGDNFDISNKYYWALVINTNNEERGGESITVNVGTSENIDMQPCHYIDISDIDFDGDLSPEVGDEIAMLGYRGEDDPARQNAIYISSYDSLDIELKAPLIVQYRGINDFNLASHKYTWFSGGVTAEGELNGREANEMRGSFKLEDGKTVGDEFSYLYSYISQVKFTAEENQLSVGYIYSYYNTLSQQMEEKVSWSYITQHADEINLNIVDGLKQTGIDIKTGQVTINADNTKFLGSISMYNNDNGIVIYDDNQKAKVIMNRQKLEKYYDSQSGDYEYLPSNQAQVSTQRFDMSKYMKLGDYYTQTKSEYRYRYQNQINGFYLGNFSTSDSFKIFMNLTIRFAHKEYDKGIYDVPSWHSSDQGVYKMTYRVYCNNSDVVPSTEINLSNLQGREVSVSCNMTGDYYLDWSIDYRYDADMVNDGYTFYTIGEYIDLKLTKSANGMTFIGLNGIYSAQNADRYMVYSEEGFNIIEKQPRNITIGETTHIIENPRYMLVVNPETGPYWGYQSLTSSWNVPIGVPKLLTLSDSDFKDTQILDENGNTITVKGYNVNSNIFSMITVVGLDSSDRYLILPYAEPAQVIIYNYADYNFFVYARNVGNNSKNIFINSRKRSRNTGQWRYEMEQTDECLWMIGDRTGWNNLSLIDR